MGYASCFERIQEQLVELEHLSGKLMSRPHKETKTDPLAALYQAEDRVKRFLQVAGTVMEELRSLCQRAASVDANAVDLAEAIKEQRRRFENREVVLREETESLKQQLKVRPKQLRAELAEARRQAAEARNDAKSIAKALEATKRTLNEERSDHARTRRLLSKTRAKFGIGRVQVP